MLAGDGFSGRRNFRYNLRNNPKIKRNMSGGKRILNYLYVGVRYERGMTFNELLRRFVFGIAGSRII